MLYELIKIVIALIKEHNFKYLHELNFYIFKVNY